MADTETQGSAPPFKFRAVQPETAEPAAPSGNPDFAYEPAPEPQPQGRPWLDGMDAGASLVSGLVRGAVGMSEGVDATHRRLAEGANALSQRMLGTDLPAWDQTVIRSMPIPGMLPSPFAAFDVSPAEIAHEAWPQAMEYEPKSKGGGYIQTVAEFLPGAVGGPGSIGRNLLMQGVVPAVTSETAGRLTEGTWAEPYARFAGALLGGIGGNVLENKARSLISPGGGAAAEDLAHAARLRKAGVPVSAGLATKSPEVMAIEANNPRLQSQFGNSEANIQNQAITTAALREAGLTDEVVANAAARQAADPDLIGSPQLAHKFVLDELDAANGRMFDEALGGLDVPPLRSLADPIFQAAKIRGAPAEVDDAVNLIGDALRRGVNIPAKQLNFIRSELGKSLSSIDGNTRTAASRARDAIDDLIDSAAAAAGRTDRLDLLNEARRRYQAALVLKEAVARSSGRGLTGIIQPKDLEGALKSVYGRPKTVTGNVNRMGYLAESGLRMRPLAAPAKSWKKLIPFGELLGGAGGGFGLLQGAAMLGAPLKLAAIPAGIGFGVAAADAARRGARAVLERFAHTPTVQGYLENQLVNPNAPVGKMASGALGVAAGTPSYLVDQANPQAYGGRVERKAGGRVGIDHDKLADQLVTAAERAKKGISKGTEQLLDLPDDHIAHALEVANRSI